MPKPLPDVPCGKGSPETPKPDLGRNLDTAFPFRLTWQIHGTAQELS